jgi:hypothetical protein
MKKKRRSRVTRKEDRQLIQMAAASATLEEAAATYRTSLETIGRKAEKLGLPLKGAMAENGCRLALRIWA